VNLPLSIEIKARVAGVLIAVKAQLKHTYIIIINYEIVLIARAM